MDFNKFEERKLSIENVVGNQLNLYWDVPEDYPVIEVFTYGLEKDVDLRIKEMQARLNESGITKDVAELVAKELEDNYFRIDCYFGRDISEEQLIDIMKVMKDFGHKEYSYVG
jgi:hypothetical protein